MLTLIEAQNLIEKQINNLQLPEEPTELYEPVRYILALGGKRVRPALMLLGCDLFAGSVDSALLPAIGIELFHNFTLLHDDIMDKSVLRRGKETVHVKWNENVAILSGDVMSMLASRLMNQAPGAVLAQVHEVFTKTAMEVCEGQQFDMNFESRISVEESEYLRMVELKTAVLIAASLKIGAMLGGAAEKDAQDLYNFGKNLGIAFQLQDDLLDIFGDSSMVGKKKGMDIIDNKKTILMILALRESNVVQKEKLMYWLTAEKFNPEEKITSVVEIFEMLGIRALTEAIILDYYDKALGNLKKLNRPEERKRELFQFAKYLMNRKN